MGSSELRSPTLNLSIACPQLTPAASTFPAAASNYCQLDELLTEEEKDLQIKVRQFMENEVAPIISKFWEKAEFPFHLIPKMSTLGIAGGTIKAEGTEVGDEMHDAAGLGEDGRGSGDILLPRHPFVSALQLQLLATTRRPIAVTLFPHRRVAQFSIRLRHRSPRRAPPPPRQPGTPTAAASTSTPCRPGLWMPWTFWPSLRHVFSRDRSCGCKHSLILPCSVMPRNAQLGSEAQKEKYLRPLSKMQKALSEPNHGSDASSLNTTARKVPGGWILNGQKRWPANSSFADIFVVLACNTSTNKINGFIVNGGAPGLKISKIDNKMSLRVVQNCDILLEDVFVPDDDRLPGANSFQDPVKALSFSRVIVAWISIGIAAGVSGREEAVWGAIGGVPAKPGEAHVAPRLASLQAA
uniref:Acyl-CoA oxidase/dehydrogenase middle domain-containing protein n=1 Tax=Oryza rufipogon TaxID=4529 RepID=A0A0E0PXJ8_ORYRU